ncbi:discoidin domain-containing protein [bacterium]|nr:discoidin domain-containing protein [bacterium]
MWRHLWVPCLLALCCTVRANPAVPIAESLRAELHAEWDRDAGLSLLPPNPSGEIQGAATYDDAAGAVDGKKTGSYGFHTTNSEKPWWQVDLGQAFVLDHLLLYNRNESQGLMDRSKGMLVLVSTDSITWKPIFEHTGPAFGGARDGKPLLLDLRGKQVEARWVRCQLPGKNSFHLDEVEVYPTNDPARNIALKRPADQSSAGRSSVSHGIGKADSGARYTIDLSRQVLTRAQKLLALFRERDPNPRTALTARLQELETAAQSLDRQGKASSESQRDLYYSAREVLRQVAFSNPLLTFRDLLFVKREPGVLAHMCDQYFGSLQRPGGGLFALEDAFGEPRLRDVIGDALPPGNFLTPSLSPEGRTVLFAYAQGEANRKLSFTREARFRFHLFRVNLDGTDLRQLTEGPYDDLHPCWLPDGDLVFMSTRRGGETRCSGRPVPTYTLHRMRADGSGLQRLSDHETHEWLPAVGHDGSILYTRWDYVDRHTNLSHSLWQCRPDGSGAMAIYGQYNHERKPWGLWHVRPVPDSPRLMAVAGAHHGYAYGSLALLNPLLGFDGSAPLERLTPEVAFPEAEGYPSSAYTTPWPLSDDFWLTSYSPRWSTQSAAHSVTLGVYLQDRFGNRELIYRDPTISIESAAPVQTSPTGFRYPAPRDDQPSWGRMMLLNVYDSVAALPAVRVKWLRLVQILPKTTYAADDPKMSVARQISARAVIGTVPVEEDGSANFVAPARVPLYFQALDEKGMAVQTMRSLAYLQPGEVRSCIGCHEPRQTAPANRRAQATLREPSQPVAGPEGTRPFSYQRLVQPVLDRHCVTCHQPGGSGQKLPLTGDFASDKDPFTRSYRSLAQKKYVPWFDSVNGGEWIPETTPGQFGARSSGLVRMLLTGHHDVKLPPEDLQRLCLWIDLNVPFYGCYEPAHVAMQRKGEVVPFEQLLQ